jgi:3-(3-hydroxy-phenyl)propionate hydroxylase
MTSYDVLVVGLGPCGAMLAHLLALHPELTILGVDKAPELYPKPRAIAMDSEAMRAIQRVGLASELEGMLGVYPPSEFRNHEFKLLRQIRPADPPYPLSWASYGSFVQPEVDKLLRDKLGERSNVTVKLGMEVVALEQSDEMATVEFANGSKVSAKYVIGCDGGTSSVRKLMQSTSEDLAFDEPWIIVGGPYSLLPSDFLKANLPVQSQTRC